MKFIIKVLGRGAQGKVMLVQKRNTLELFALKSFRKGDIYYDYQIDQINSERKVLEVIQHPNLLKLEYAFQTPQKLFIVTKFMPGGELLQHLKMFKCFSEQLSRFYVTEIVLALEYLHSLNIIYRDLKLENILLDEDGHVKLADFGLTKILPTNRSKTSTQCGTPKYLAPEVLSAEDYTISIDWWCLGICLYLFLFGIPPFYGETMLEDIKKKDVEFPYNAPKEAKDLIKQLLQKNPEQRIDCNGIKKHAWLKTVKWDKITEPPYKPNISSKDWVCNFDQQFICESPKNSYSSLNENLQEDEFENFNYIK